MTREMRSALALAIVAAMFSLIFMFGSLPAAEKQEQLHKQLNNNVISMQR